MPALGWGPGGSVTRHADRGCSIRRPRCLAPSEDGELRGSTGRTCRKQRFCGYFSLFFPPIEAAAFCFFFGTFRLFLKVAGRRCSCAAGRVDTGAGGSAHPRVPETPPSSPRSLAPIRVSCLQPVRAGKERGRHGRSWQRVGV